MNDTATVKVWDIGVRVFHWALVALFVIAYISSEGAEHGGIGEALHAWSGYAIIGLLAFRIVWGFVGSTHARFSDFVYSPGSIIAYLKGLFTAHPKRYLGHNPAGGAMVLLMLFSLIAVSWTGLKAYQAEGKGPLAAAPAITLGVPVAQADDDWDEHGGYGHGKEEFWEEAHEASVNFMLLLIVLHLGGVALSSLLHRENLPRAMLTGRKQVDTE